jgi:ABC-type arginine transport system permease subunit
MLRANSIHSDIILLAHLFYGRSAICCNILDASVCNALQEVRNALTDTFITLRLCYCAYTAKTANPVESGLGKIRCAGV